VRAPKRGRRLLAGGPAELLDRRQQGVDGLLLGLADALGHLGDGAVPSRSLATTWS
jgi:hypothetical protein